MIPAQKVQSLSQIGFLFPIFYKILKANLARVINLENTILTNKLNYFRNHHYIIFKCIFYDYIIILNYLKY